MKRSQPWHDTPIGGAACWLGSIQFAIPVLIMLALALGWGTYLESTQDARVARAAVYGSWWFMALMALVCVSLILAVVTRFPFKRNHAGFIIVHAALVTMIVGGFVSLLGRIEGHIALDQGSSSGTLEMDQERLELAEHDAGQFRTIGEIDVPSRPGKYTIGDFPVEIVDIWDNVREEFEITDDGADPYRAVQFQFGPMEASAAWVGDEARGEAPVIDGLRIRILAAGADWQPPDTSAAGPGPGYAFVVGERKSSLSAEGHEAFSGWKIVSVKRFDHALVTSGNLSEDPAQKDNPAVEVIISDGKGTTEQHTAFAKFPDMILSKTLEGAAHSGARLVPDPTGAPGANEETVVVYGTPPSLRLGYIGKNGAVKQLDHDGALPWTADLGDRKLTILKQFSKAREQSRFSKAPSAKEHRPALIIKVGQAEPQTLAWKGVVPFALPGRTAILRFKPRTVSLPFSMRLEQFRKTDYPGTDMAMSYESDVNVSLPDGTERHTTISMNNPLVQSGWKVYQSGFMGNNVSIFSVMRDPGLILTYVASALLCLGILITFYGRGLSWGHPGIPTPFSGKEHSHAPVSVRPDLLADPALNGSRGRPAPAVVSDAGLAADPGRRQSDAAGHVRA